MWNEEMSLVSVKHIAGPDLVIQKAGLAAKVALTFMLGDLGLEEETG